MALSRDRYEGLCHMLLEIEESGIELTGKSGPFIAETKARIEKWGDQIILSEAQWDWIVRIHEKATR